MLNESSFFCKYCVSVNDGSEYENAQHSEC